MTNGRTPAPWQPSEGSRLLGYLVPMVIALPVVLVWFPLLAGLSWESGLLFDGVVAFAVTAIAWWLYLRSESQPR
ncbi:hypothetical protein GCM10009795_016670 [Nocardioides hankookensis]|uniref:DUF3311 domain-containing protein n=1 Tax=Nocardioides hankookensis TaxID=443157 RepID=A0ABW1LJW6_9ACTN